MPLTSPSSSATTDDSTECRKRLEHGERDLFEQMAANVEEIFWLSPPDKSEMLYVSPAYERLWGRPREPLFDDPLAWLKGVHPEDRPRVRQSLDNQGEGEYEIEYRIRRPDGAVRWIRERAYPIEEDGQVKRIVGIARDITERKHAQQQLRASEEKFSTAFQANPLSMTIVRLDDQRILEVNEGFTRTSGYTPDEVLGRSVWELDLWVDDEDLREVTARLKDGETIHNFETRVRRTDDEIRHVFFSAERLQVDGDDCVLTATQDITRRKRYEEELEFRALHDSLTGLPNRSHFRDRLEQALERTHECDEELAVIFLDLDRFKVVNDTLGHPAGDQLLKQIARRLEQTVDDEVVIARFGGDEFVLMVEHIDAVRQARQVARRIARALDEPCEVTGTDVHARASLGIAVSNADHRSADDLLRYADVAMFDSKSTDGTSIDVFEHDSDLSVTQKLHYENDLREAVDQRQFVVRYQPVFDLEHDRVVGVEALARWDHPGEGLLPPSKFIPLAEETGLIVPIGYQIFEQAAATVADWHRHYPATPEGRPFRLAINLSARQYQTEDLVTNIRRITDQKKLPLDSLILEITESILISGDGKLQSLRDEGLKVAIDDFGTGYSSLQYLRELEADALKIDRSFVAGLQQEGRENILIEAIVTIGRKFGMDVVAEGVETDNQLEQLKQLGGKFGQGYYFARPLSAEDFQSKYFG